MANPEDVKKITGYTIGGVSPIGHLTKIKIFIDETLNRFSSIFRLKSATSLALRSFLRRIIIFRTAALSNFGAVQAIIPILLSNNNRATRDLTGHFKKFR